MPEITTYYLEMKYRDLLRDKPNAGGLDVVEAKIKQYKFNKFLYQFVGENWAWFDKLALTEEQWREYSENDNLRTWVAYYQGSIAGYYELQKQAQGSTEIAYFGLAPGFIGKGNGGYLLSHATRSAWDWQGTERVWVHTCTLDHPGALRNYLRRGFEIYREETAIK